MKIVLRVKKTMQDNAESEENNARNSRNSVETTEKSVGTTRKEEKLLKNSASKE